MRNIRQKHNNQWHIVVLCTIFAKKNNNNNTATNDTQWHYAQYSPYTQQPMTHSGIMHNIRQKHSNQMTHSGIMHNIRQKYSNQWHTVVVCTIFTKNPATNDTQW